MSKLYFTIAAFLIFSCTCYSQQNPSDKKLLDSLIKEDELLGMLAGLDKPKSYVTLNVSVGNKLFSVNNNALNALQQDKKIIFTPSVGYYHKSGFGISFAGYIISDKNNSGFYQYSLTPSYDYTTGSGVAAGISFSRFFVQDKYSGSTSPVQNDLYVYANLKKGWLKPGVAFGYSTGNYNEIIFVDTNLIIQNREVRIQFTDTVNTKLKSLILVGTLSHTFTGYDILTKKDGLTFTPQLLLNVGSNKYDVTHKSSRTSFRANRIPKTKLRNVALQSQTTGLLFQSLGLNLDLNYAISKFNFEPQVYFDYYLPSTTEKRFTQVFSLNIGYTF